MKEKQHQTVQRAIKTFVLRQGRMTEAQQRDYNELSGRWRIPYTPSALNFIDVFDNMNPVVVEIGFGMGKATAIIAEQNPDKNYLGIEVHTPGVGKLLGEIRNKDLHNLYIIQHDAVEVLETMLQDNSISAFHVFFPDPWPKKKHYKRRLMQRPVTNLLASKLSTGGYIYMATDWEPYAEFALEELSQTEKLINRYDSYAPHQKWRPETRFEQKGLSAEREIYELIFEKSE
ncbi:MAG: tRNA (guanosine(46)-N7)-methyltransferase TrmB [Treponema sp.]|nr:tRNA (guanosine(46)-N7)-methyltransferase TrmB [Treponema sp.]